MHPKPPHGADLNRGSSGAFSVLTQLRKRLWSHAQYFLEYLGLRCVICAMRYCSVSRKSEVPVCWRALFARFPPSAHRASRLRTYSFAHTQPTRQLPCSRAQPSATVARALLSPWQRTPRSLWRAFKAKQGEKTRGLEATLEPEGTKSGFSSARLPLRQEFCPWCAIPASRFT